MKRELAMGLLSYNSTASKTIIDINLITQNGLKLLHQLTAPT
jgi:hypothetical protein